MTTPPYRNWLVIVAMDVEEQAVLARLPSHRAVEISSALQIHTKTATVAGRHIHVAKSGVGLVNAALTTAFIADRQPVEVDAEVQVVASGYTAENGRSNGGLVNYVTKSGTSQLRGTGWYTAKRDSWVANDYLRLRQGTAKPLYRVNIGGFSVGGPVVIPKVLDSRTSKRKVFFFGSQEFTKDARPTQTAIDRF